jgi:kumamolisin
VIPDAGTGFVALPGSERAPLARAVVLGPVDPAERIEVALVTRRRAELPAELVTGPQVLSRDELAARHGSDPADVDLIRSVLAPYGIEVSEADLAGRRVTATGTAGALAEAFGASLSWVRTGHPAAAGGIAEHRYRVGSLHVPAELAGVVTAVLGLDNRPQARGHARPPGDRVVRSSYTPPQVADIYRFPAGADGSGETLAFVELGGGFSQSDLDLYFHSLGLPTPSVTAISVDRASNVPGRDPAGSDAEVVPNIEIAGAVAPGAAQVVYFAPNSDRGFVDAVTTAVHASPTPTVVAISWGQSEDSWTDQARSALDQAFADAAALGVTVSVAAGNGGSGDGVGDGRAHVDFPSSSPHVLACGGTSLQADPATGAIVSETVWNDGPGGGATGGGVSGKFSLPAYQSSAGVPDRDSGGLGRGVPDVAGNADPATGYQVLIGGQHTVAGGTSAAAALWAGLLCRVAQASGRRLGAIQHQLYAGVTPGTSTPGFRSITTGNNGAYAAGPGWDACTGLGSPNGAALLTRLAGRESAAPAWAEPEGAAPPRPSAPSPAGAAAPAPPGVPGPPPPRPPSPAQRPPSWAPPPPRGVPGSVSHRHHPPSRRPPSPSRTAVDEYLVRRTFGTVAELVQPGRLLFNPPDQMKLGQTARVEVRLTRTLDRDAELLTHLRGAGDPQLEEIPTAPLMAVALKGDGFKITGYSDEEQRVSHDDVTTWEFDIEALKRGQQRLVLSVSLRVPVPGQPVEHKSIPVREATIVVHVGTPALVAHFVAGNWQWFIGTAIAAAAVVVAVFYH